MGSKETRSDFEWSYTDEPHATRRELILRKYPQIKKLMVVDTRLKWIITAMVLSQFLFFYLLRNVYSIPWLAFLAYFIGGTMNHSLSLAIHEISHNHAFGPSKLLYSKLFGIFANLPIGIPLSIKFKKYHLGHHRRQGDDIIDVDIPSTFEAQFFTTTFRKFIWVILSPIFYAFRPLFVYPQVPTTWEYINVAVQLIFNLTIGFTLGWHVVAYMMFASVACMGLHPCAGHFISEHYIMFEINKRQLINKAMQLNQLKQLDEDDLSKCEYINGVYTQNGKMLIPETCSYYGPLNWLTFNIGYHVEHHDFPSIPGSLLPQVRKIAPEYYESLYSHTSWLYVLYRYIVDPDVGPFSRVKRPHQPEFAAKFNDD